MSHSPAPNNDARGPLSSWQALNGDAASQVPAPPMSMPMPMPAPMPQHAPPPPLYGGWQQPWQDQHGQAHYPYAAQQAALQQQPLPLQAPPQQEPPPPDPPERFIAPEQLEPVGPPRYAAPARIAQDPRQKTMAAVITFIALVIGLWAIMGFTGTLAKTLVSIRGGSEKLRVQLVEANKQLVTLDQKTSHLNGMSDSTKELGGLLVTIDKDMGGMLGGVDKIAASMTDLEASLTTLDSELGKVNEISVGMGSQLGEINSGLGSQVKSVRTMRKDVVATGRVLGTLPGRLDATNGRLGHVNNSVNIMGCRGILNNMQVEIFAGPLRTGAAHVSATIVPPGAWGTLKDGKTPC
ncbi:MAG: hypothetical protein ABI200_05855 [Gaiellales bacterium]